VGIERVCRTRSEGVRGGDTFVGGNKGARGKTFFLITRRRGVNQLWALVMSDPFLDITWKEVIKN